MLVIASLKPSSNGKSIMVNFQETTQRDWSVASNLSDFQRAQGMEAAGGTDTITRYATERLTLEAAAGLTEGQEIVGFHIQTYQSGTPIYIVDGVAQKAAKNGAYFDGQLVSAGLGDAVPADKSISMDSHPERYRVVTQGKTVRGIAAVQAMKDLRAAAAVGAAPLTGAPVGAPAATADATL